MEFTLLTDEQLDLLPVGEIEAQLEAFVHGEDPAIDAYLESDGINDEVTGYGDGWTELGSWWPGDRKPGEPEGMLVPSLGAYVTVVESFGGMDKGTTRWIVYKVGNRLFRKNGWYASHYGSEFDGDFSEVRAREKMVTVYE